MNKNYMAPVKYENRQLFRGLACSMPMSGLGLDLARAAVLDLDHETMLDALDAVTTAPAYQLGVPFGRRPAWDQPFQISEIVEDPEMFLSDHGFDALLAVGEMPPVPVLLWCLPIINVPRGPAGTFSEDDWVFPQHVGQLLRFVKANPSCLENVPRGLPPQAATAKRNFVPQPAGPTVWRDDVERFCHFYPGLSPRLWEAVARGTGRSATVLDSALANEVASMMFGIEVDLRHGFLFPRDDLGMACELVWRRLDAANAVPLITPFAAEICGCKSLVGACWSQTLNAVLNGDEDAASSADPNLLEWLTCERPAGTLVPAKQLQEGSVA